jgi:hypothetical protein
MFTGAERLAGNICRGIYFGDYDTLNHDDENEKTRQDQEVKHTDD